MVKFNKPTSVSKKIASRPDATANEEGGLAFKTDAKIELMIRIASSLVSENSFYKSGKELDAAIVALAEKIGETDPVFLLKLAKYAREKLYLRSAPVVLMGEYSLGAWRGKVPDASNYLAATIQRVDEIPELLAYIDANRKRATYKSKFPMVVKHGIAKAFVKFNEYQIAKYNREGKFTIKDAMFLCHPKPISPEQVALFKAIAEDKLAIPATWETFISANGSTKENWEKIAPKMGYMALLRNLRNFIDKGVELTPILKRITDPEQVARSKQFPYRFYSAYKEINGGTSLSTNFRGYGYRIPTNTAKKIGAEAKVLAALSDAMEASVANIPEYSGTTFVTCDISGSMQSPLSEKSKIERSEVGCLFGAMLARKNPDTVTSVFATDHVPVALNPKDSILTNATKLLSQDTNGCGTDAWKVMEWLCDNKVFVDRIVLFSDMQCYNSSNRFGHGTGANIYSGLIKYRSTVNPKVFVYSFDLASYGTTQFPENDSRVCLAGGFSDQILKFIPAFERSRVDMLAEVEATTLWG